MASFTGGAAVNSAAGQKASATGRYMIKVTGQNARESIVGMAIRMSGHGLFWNEKVPSNIWYKAHQIPKLKCLPFRLAVVFAQTIEARY